MKFSEVRKVLKTKLLVGEIQHEARHGGFDKKNLLATGDVTPDDVIEMLDCAKVFNFKVAKHHNKEVDINVYIFTPSWNDEKWYIKAYIIEPDAWFISVHPSE